MSLQIHTQLLCSAERAAIARKAEQRRRTIDTIILSITVLTLGIGLGSICALADLPHGLVFLVLVLWSVWAMRLIFMRPPISPQACTSVPVRDQSVKS